MRKIFAKFLGLIVLALVVQTAAMELIFGRLFFAGGLSQTTGNLLHLLERDALWSGLIALAAALPVAAWAAIGIAARLQRVGAFARRMALGELSARLPANGSRDEIATIEAALNQTAEQLGKSFAEIESRRQELAAMLDAMQEAVVAVTPEGLVRWSNAVMERIAGTQVRHGLPLAHSVRDPELLGCMKSALEQRAMRSGRTSSLAAGCIFEITAAPLPSGGALAVLHDVTRVETAEKSRSDFIANVSHELRTPLTSIQGYVETLIEEPVPNAATVREFLEIILKNATRMNRLTEDLLALAGVESAGYKLALEPTQASVLLREAIDSAGGMVVDTGVALETAGAPDTLVLANADAMNQVFGNLIENALKYGKPGKRIEVGARLLDSEAGTEVMFSVRDFGAGIASEHLGRIFERFYRVDKARSRESGGTGLGLAIVKHIVLAHGGRVWVESELGHGAAFHFALPRCTPEAAKAAPPTASL